MMALRVRLICMLAWTSISVFLLYYTCYHDKPWHLVYAGFFSNDMQINGTIKPVSTSGATSSAEKNVQKNIQPIPRSEEHSVDKTTQGVLTEAIYETGHSIINEQLCPNFGTDINLFVGVISAPSHEEARMAIRQTWGHYSMRSDVSLAFVVGTSKEASINVAITKESATYRDIIRGNFLDSYNNLTLKTVSFLEWIDNYCSGTKYILKTDDDMFINFEKLFSFLKTHSTAKKTIYGRLAKKWKPIRNSRSKYFVSLSQFSPTVFPDFTTGPAYLLTSDIVHDIYRTALNHTYLKLEDVFTTGIVAQSVGVKRVHVNEFVNKKIPFNVCNIKKNISIHMVRFHEQFDLWKKLLDGRSKCR